MRKCIDMGKDGKIIINDKDMLKPDIRINILRDELWIVHLYYMKSIPEEM